MANPLTRHSLSLQRAAWPLLFLFCGFLLNLGGAPLFDLDEGAFSEASREIVESGVWSATYLDAQPRYDKPIFTYWLQASSIKAFGIHEVSLRLHSAFAALLWAAAIYNFVRSSCDRKTATAAVLIFSSTLLVTVIGRAATADALLNLFIALSFFDIYRYSQTHSRHHMLRSWVWISLGMLTKGPVAAAIPLLVSGLWFASERKLPAWRRAIVNPYGWLILALILAPWLLAIWQEQGAGFFKGFLLDHNLKRFTDTREGHGGQWYYYFLMLPVALLPFSGMLIGLARLSTQLWQRPWERLLLIWFAVVFTLVSFSKTQLPHYVLYGVTPLLILFAKYRSQLVRSHLQLGFPALFFALQIALYFYVQEAASGEENLYMKALLAKAPQYLNKLYLGSAIAALLICLGLCFIQISHWKKLALAGLLQSLFCFTLFIPAIAGMQQAPVKAAALSSRHLEQELIAYRINMPSFSAYRNAITHRRPPEIGDVIFTREDKLGELQAQFPGAQLDIFFRDGGIVLLHLHPPVTGLENPITGNAHETLANPQHVKP